MRDAAAHIKIAQVIPDTASTLSLNDSGPITTYNQALGVVPKNVTNKQIAQIEAIFNINTTPAQHLASTHSLAINILTTQTQM
jgi:hypothetical protein